VPEKVLRELFFTECMVVKHMRVAILCLFLLSVPLPLLPTQETHTPIFHGSTAYDHLTAQCDFGPRPPGSGNLSLCRQYIVDTLESYNWTVTLQNFTYKEVDCVNIIGTWASEESSPYVLGAHYDTRPFADNDPDISNRNEPVLGANDGASGVGVLLELANVLPVDIRSSVELVFFDAEDSGNIDGWDWIVGSTYYVDQLTPTRIESINGMILVDMVGDASLRLPREGSSTQSLQDAVWDIANNLSHGDIFLEESGSSIIDDHRPFLLAGIPALDLIHTPFPWYWHTVEDTPDKCSAESLEVVGEVLEVFIVTQSIDFSTFEENGSIDVFLIALIVSPIVIVSIFILYRRK
ncbi:MAG: M28 family peptidase, partial [Candidatus Thorarchaeota archaeon]